ncbi:hypothetical protein AQUCO_01700440v1 [Aquilegia coerulea]|uniref:Phytocyanin domain-containing protein n=1 Tax=Aquilegia coerulea TaxID=218851 RepID=A0A2G5DMX8_AQUCA|nr:hypothetical protein AQUCO_01700440v1 [Aquilegia coerulea]
MAFVNKSVVFFMLLAVLHVSMATATVYKVGDSAGWTVVKENKDYYKNWAASKTFKVGDEIVFEYDAKAHDVIEVTKEDYNTCTVSKSPLHKFKTGNDTIPITVPGHFFYICSVQGHCHAGQKVDIRVPEDKSSKNKSSEVPSASPSASPSAKPSGGHSHSETPAPAPTHNSAVALSSMGVFGMLAIGLVALAF